MIHLSSLRPENLSVYQYQDGGVERVTGTDGFDQHPIPAPDGKGVVYSGSENGSHHLFYLSDGDRVKLTDHPLFEDHARFSQDGYLYFCSDYDGTVQIYRAKWEGARIMMPDAEQITKGMGNCFSFAVSPDGKELVFSSNRDNQAEYMGPQPDENFHAGQLYRMRIGRPETCKRLLGIEGGHWEGTPEYSPDGKFVVFYSNHDGLPKLYRYHFNLGALDKISDKASAYPAFQDDGALLYSEKGKKYWKIRRISCDGSQIRTVLKRDGNCIAPRPLSNNTFYFYSESGKAQSFVVDEGAVKGIPLRVIRGFFPIVEGKDTTYIEEMNSVKRCSHEIFKSDQFVFGLARTADGNTVTTEGVPFQSTESHLVALCPYKNLTGHLKAARNAHPSSAGDSIVFSRQEFGGRKQLHLLKEGKLERLAEDDEDHVFPTVHGERVVFSSTIDKKRYRLKMLDLKTREVQVLTEGFVDIHARFSPDGKFLVFTSNRGGMKTEKPLCFFFNPQPYGDLFLLDMETKRITQLTSSPYEDSTPEFE